jgi:hypothetical protein
MRSSPTPEEICRFLEEHFSDVIEGPQEGHFCVFHLKTRSGTPRSLRIHADAFIFGGRIARYFREINLVGQLDNGNVEFIAPLAGI